MGDNSPAITKIRMLFFYGDHRDETGKPATLPRQFQVSHIQSGQLRKSHFQPLNSLAYHPSKHDKFIEEGIRMLHEENESFNNGRK